MMSSFEVGDCEGIKAEPGLDGGVGLPFAGLEDTPLAALHHLHQVSLSCLTVDCTYHHAFIHPPTHSLARPFAHSLVIHSLTDSVTFLFPGSFVFMSSFTSSAGQSLAHSDFCPFDDMITVVFMHLFIHLTDVCPS